MNQGQQSFNGASGLRSFFLWSILIWRFRLISSDVLDNFRRQTTQKFVDVDAVGQRRFRELAAESGRRLEELASSYRSTGELLKNVGQQVQVGSYRDRNDQTL